MPSKMVGTISWPCGGLLPSLGRDSWLGGQQAATTSRAALGSFQVSDERDGQRRKNRTSLPWAAPSLWPMQSGKPVLQAASPKPPFWPMRLFTILKCHRGILKEQACTETSEQSSPDLSTTPSSVALRPSAVGTWQHPCHLWLYVHCLVQIPQESIRNDLRRNTHAFQPLGNPLITLGEKVLV